MPLKIAGSVSARFSVRFSRINAVAELAGRRVERLDAAAAHRGKARSRRETTWSDARFLVPASVSVSVPS